MKRRSLFLGVVLLSFCSWTVAHAAVLFESGTLGPTGVTGTDVFSQIVPGGNVNSSSFVGARFHINTPMITTQVGGHFVLSPNVSGGSFFGAVIALNSINDIPDSNNLSTPDVIGTTTMAIPSSSALVFRDISVALQPGWYGIVFGSGLFDTTGIGAALRNNIGIDDLNHFGFLSGFGWGNRPDDMYFIVLGNPIPEPTSCVMVLISCAFFNSVALLGRHQRFWSSQAD